MNKAKQDDIMNNRDAIQFLEKLLYKLLLRGDFTDVYGDMEDSSLYEVAVEIAKQAIKKQIPKKLKTGMFKVVIQGNLYENKCYICPLCGIVRGNADYQPEKIIKYPFCPNCGQALDWSDSDAKV